jgi:hypothetical protein
MISIPCHDHIEGGSIEMIDLRKSAALSLLMTLVVLPAWQIVEAADGVRGRHSLIHRPQIQPTPALKPAPSAPQPQLYSSPHSLSTPSRTVQRKIVRRPAAPASPSAEVSPIDPGNSAQIDPPPISPQFDNPDDAPPEPEMVPPPEPQESPNTDAR